ncbi:hypothetical protein NHJ13051_000978 [Beauveria bassiana]
MGGKVPSSEVILVACCVPTWDPRYVVGAQFVCGVTVVGMTACGGIFTPPPPLLSPPPAYQRQVRQCI